MCTCQCENGHNENILTSYSLQLRKNTHPKKYVISTNMIFIIWRQFEELCWTYLGIAHLEDGWGETLVSYCVNSFTLPSLCVSQYCRNSWTNSHSTTEKSSLIQKAKKNFTTVETWSFHITFFAQLVIIATAGLEVHWETVRT
jgi:hypothetical protein